MKTSYILAVLVGSFISAYPIAKAMVGRARKEDYQDFILTKIGITPDKTPRLNFAIHFLFYGIVLSGIVLTVVKQLASV